MSNSEIKTTKLSYKSCFVPKCKSTTIKTPDKTFIYVPKDEITRKSWCKAAGHEGPLMLNSYICEDHFNLQEDLENYLEWKLSKRRKRLKPKVCPRFFSCQVESLSSLKKAKEQQQCIISSTTSTADCEIDCTDVKIENLPSSSNSTEHSPPLSSPSTSIQELKTSRTRFIMPKPESLHSPYKIPRLKKDVVPSQFAWTPRARCSTSLNGSTTPKTNVSSCQSQASSHEKANKRLSFNDFAPRIKLPVGWAMQYLPAKLSDILSIHERCYTATENYCKTFTKKEIIVKKDLTLQVSVLEEEIPSSILNIPSTLNTVQQLQDVIYALDKTNICSGSHKPGTMLPIGCKTAKKDVGENWRHVDCPLLVNNSKTCDFCLEAKKIVGICS